MQNYNLENNLEGKSPCKKGMNFYNYKWDKSFCTSTISSNDVFTKTLLKRTN